jgi:PTS system mannose-specific IIA component
MNIVVTSHGTLCDGLLDTYRKMVSSDSPIIAVGLGDDGVDVFRERLGQAVQTQLASGNTIILADLLGGTPYNEAYALYLENPEHLRVVSGCNFGMLIEIGVAAAASDDLDAAANLAISAGTTGITVAALPSEDEALADDDLF